jgi:hypothetical protein
MEESVLVNKCNKGFLLFSIEAVSKRQPFCFRLVELKLCIRKIEGRFIIALSINLGFIGIFEMALATKFAFYF